MKHLFKNTRGASATEYAMLLALIGGLAIVAVFSFATDARRAFDISATALASTVPGLSSAPGGAEAVFPDDPTPVVPEPTPPAAPAPTHWSVGGFWIPTGSQLLYETNADTQILFDGLAAGALMDLDLTFTGAAYLEISAIGDSTTPPVHAVALYAAEQPGGAFIVAPHISGPVGIRFTVPAGPEMDSLPLGDMVNVSRVRCEDAGFGLTCEGM